MMIISDNISKAAELLKQGEVVAFPTETVYGLGADARNEAAIRKVFQVKKRPYDHPLIVHLASLEQINDWAQEVSADALALAKAFWPGPLTLILKKQAHVLSCVTGGQDSIALRVPSHPMAQALLQVFGGGVVAPSANKFKHISPTTATAVHEELGEAVDLILDGGACEVGVESTIVDMTGKKPVILRPGMITREMITAVLGKEVGVGNKRRATTKAPGMHDVHYAPQTETMLIDTQSLPDFLQTLNVDELPVIIVMHSDLVLPHKDQVYYVQMPQNAGLYAHDLYRILRSLDHEHYKRIVIETVPVSEGWEAISDRLAKASGSQREKP